MKRYLVTTVSALSLLGMTAFSAQAGTIGKDVYAKATVDWTAKSGTSWTLAATSGDGITSENNLAIVGTVPTLSITNTGIYSSKFALVPNEMNTGNNYWALSNGKNKLHIYPFAATMETNTLLAAFISKQPLKKSETLRLDLAIQQDSANKVVPGKYTGTIELRAYTD